MLPGERTHIRLAGLKGCWPDWRELDFRWDETASDVNVVPALSQVRVGNRIEWVWGVNEGQERVVFGGIELNDPPRNIRLCEAQHEALLDAGLSTQTAG